MTPIALLFDLDGTLIDSIELLLECMEAAFDGRAHRPSRAEWVAGIGTPLRTQLAEFAVDADDVERLVARYRAHQEDRLEAMTTLYPEVADTLEWARSAGHPMAIVTSKGHIMTARSLAHVGLTSVFDTVVTYEQTTHHKPLGDPVHLALDRLGYAGARALFVGDSPHDMYAGRAAGVRTAAAEWGPFPWVELAPSRPTYRLAHMSELKAVVSAVERDESGGGPHADFAGPPPGG